MLQQNVYGFLGVQFPAIIANYNIFNYCYVNKYTYLFLKKITVNENIFFIQH